MDKLILIKSPKTYINQAHPLPSRNIIPVPSPKFGNKMNYM